MAKQTTRAKSAKAPTKRTTNSKQATQAALRKQGSKAAPTPISEARSARKNQASAKPTQSSNGTDAKLRDQVREAFQAGETRTQLRSRFNLSYPQVYNMTKDLGTQEHGRDRIIIDDPDRKGQRISRKAAMQRDFLAGMSVGDIGRKYGVIYQVAYQATAAQLDAPEQPAKASKGAKAETAGEKRRARKS